MPSRETQTDSSALLSDEIVSFDLLEERAMMSGDYFAFHEDCEMPDESDSISTHSSFHRSFEICSLAVGILIGFFVQLTTLGANILLLEFWDGDFFEITQQEVVFFSLLWSLLTSVMALLILGFLRALLTSFFRSLPIADSYTIELIESLHEEMLENMEIRFVMGALVGVCLAWTITDLYLGMVSQVGYSLLTLSASLLWCRAVMWFRSCDVDEHVYLEEEDEAKLLLV